MKKLFILGIIALLFIGYANAADTVDRGTISVTTEAMEELSPTSVKISFAIETQSKDAQTAAELNKKASESAINAVKTLVNTQKGETIKTTSYYLNPEYNYKDGQRKLNGYIASNTLQVNLKDIEKAGKVISLALANGANSVNNLQFVLDETSENCDMLMQKAAAQAKKRAEKIAASIGAALTGVKNIDANCSSSQIGGHSNYRVLSAKANVDGAVTETAAMPVEAGKTQLRAYLHVDFYVK